MTVPAQNDFLQMQREAERRVMEMQRRAKHRVEPETPAPAPPAPPREDLPAPRQRGFLDMLNVKSLLEGKDTSLVLMILALLNGEQSDPLLMLALLYIML